MLLDGGAGGSDTNVHMHRHADRVRTSVRTNKSLASKVHTVAIDALGRRGCEAMRCACLSPLRRVWGPRIIHVCVCATHESCARGQKEIRVQSMPASFIRSMQPCTQSALKMQGLEEERAGEVNAEKVEGGTGRGERAGGAELEWRGAHARDRKDLHRLGEDERDADRHEPVDQQRVRVLLLEAARVRHHRPRAPRIQAPRYQPRDSEADARAAALALLGGRAFAAPRVQILVAPPEEQPAEERLAKHSIA